MKTKNAPKDLKCKVNHTFFLETEVPKRGGGVRHFGKIPKKSCFFWVASLTNNCHLPWPNLRRPPRTPRERAVLRSFGEAEVRATCYHLSRSNRCFLFQVDQLNIISIHLEELWVSIGECRSQEVGVSAGQSEAQQFRLRLGEITCHQSIQGQAVKKKTLENLTF